VSGQIVRQLRGRGSMAFGLGMRKEVFTHEQLMRSTELRPAALAAQRMLLLRFLDPPLLQRGVHLGPPASLWHAAYPAAPQRPPGTI
jgi:hypothetical protein